MSKSSLLIWFFLAILLLLPTAFGRLIIDIAGGLMVLIVTLPLIVGGAGWITWKILIKPRLITCPNCGITSFNQMSQCTVCGAAIERQTIDQDSEPASNATIDITPK